MGYQTYIKDPDARLDYPANWEPWLTAVSDFIVTADAEVVATVDDNGDPVAADFTDAAPVEVDDFTNTTLITVPWLQGGTLTYGYVVRTRVTTAEGRVDDRSILVKIKEK